MATRNSNRTTNKLNPSEVKSAKAKDKIYRLSDGEGLMLTVKPIIDKASGLIVGEHKYWQLRYRFAGKENTASLGTYPDTSLKDAREARTESRFFAGTTIQVCTGQE